MNSQNGTQSSSREEVQGSREEMQDSRDSRINMEDSDARATYGGGAQDSREKLNSSDTDDFLMSDNLRFEFEDDNPKIVCYILSVSILLLIVITFGLMYYFTESDYVTEYDTSKIPFQYQLSLRYLYAINDRYDYVISKFPDHDFIQDSNFTTRDVYGVSNDNSTTNLNASNPIELGLLISRSLRILTPGFYEVQEDRYLPNGTTYRVITATASYTNLFYIAWAPPITIKFVTSDESSYNDLISCEYQFIWTIILNGYVNRK
ncbi:8378_t:CDS:1, partial [Racocetra fulgida]